jgi:hypothetical protein
MCCGVLFCVVECCVVPWSAMECCEVLWSVVECVSHSVAESVVYRTGGRQGYRTGRCVVECCTLRTPSKTKQGTHQE